MTDAAAKAEVDRTTLHRWMRDPEFIAAYNEARGEVQAATRAALADLGREAVQVLRDLLRTADVPAAVRLKAAVEVLTMLGATSPEEPGPTDAAAIRRDQELSKMSPFDQMIEQLKDQGLMATG